jgi:Phosphate-selective porin O and P
MLRPFGPSSLPRRLLFPIFAFVLLFQATLANAQVVIKVNDTVNFRLGAQFQMWADEQQVNLTATSQSYAQNLFMRRIRFLLTGQLAPNLTFFFQTDNPNLGKTPKTFGGTFLVQDAWFEYKVSDALQFDGGEFLVPLSRDGLTSTLSFITLDVSPTSTVYNAATQSNGLRDLGFQAKGYIVDGRLEYRAAVFQGVRDPAARNSFRHSGYLQWDFWEKERGYVYAGTNLGKKRVLALSGGLDGQKGYKAYSGTLHTTIPVAGTNEFAGQLAINHYDGGKFLTAIPRQNDYLAQVGYYIAPAKFQPFAKWEDQKFGVTSVPSKDVRRYGVGANYYVSGQNLKLTGQLTHVTPQNSAIKSTNEFTLQVQAWYY